MKWKYPKVCFKISGFCSLAIVQPASLLAASSLQTLRWKEFTNRRFACGSLQCCNLEFSCNARQSRDTGVFQSICAECSSNCSQILFRGSTASRIGKHRSTHESGECCQSCAEQMGTSQRDLYWRRYAFTDIVMRRSLDHKAQLLDHWIFGVYFCVIFGLWALFTYSKWGYVGLSGTRCVSELNFCVERT